MAAPDTQIKVGGTWTSIDDCLVKVGGTWETVDKIYAKIAGTWEEVYSGVTVTLSGETISDAETDPTNAVAAVRIGQDGKVYENVGAGYSPIDTATDWVIPNSAAPDDYEVRYTGLSGDAMTSETAAEDTWWPLSSGNFTLQVLQASIGSKTNTFTIEIRKGSSGSAIASNTYSLQALVISGS